MSNEDVLTDNKKYELMVIVNPDIGEDGIKKRLDKLRKQITTAKGEITFEEIWGLRDLAYSIRKHDKGYYAVLDFMYEPNRLKELEASLRLEPEVLRHMVTILPATYEHKDYVALAEIAAAAEAKEELENPRKGGKRRNMAPFRPEVKVEAKKVEAPKTEDAKPVKAEEPKVETKKEDAPKKVTKNKEEKKQTLEDVDAKLKSIIDNPDINF